MRITKSMKAAAATSAAIANATKASDMALDATVEAMMALIEEVGFTAFAAEFEAAMSMPSSKS